MKLSVLLSAIIALLTISVSTIQADTADSAASESSKHIYFHGTVMAIDTSANMITVHTADGDMTMAITSDTKFKGSKSMSDLKVGDQVSGMFMTDDSAKVMVVSVRIYSSKA
jgi:Cu/Ag efflux protein CusF